MWQGPLGLWGIRILPVQVTGWKPVTRSDDRLEAGPTL